MNRSKNENRLSPLDTSFLYAESAAAHMHVGSLSLFDGGDVGEEAINRHIENRLHLVPRYRQKLAWVPAQQGRPVWVDDPYFHIRNHVFHVGLPRPGGEQELLKLTSRLLSRPLDRRLPLWELWVVHMENGRLAIISKSHHCLVDGISAVDIGTALMDLTKEPPEEAELPSWTPAPEPSPRELLSDALRERLTQPAEMMRSVRAATRAPRLLMRQGLELARGVLSFSRSGLERAPQTSFTKPISPLRRFAIVRTRLSDFKAVKSRFGCTVNDVLLSVVAGAVRRLLQSRGDRVDGLILKTMVPVSVRAESERNTYGNKVSWVVAELPVGVEDPVERLRLVHEGMSHLKATKQAVGAEVWFKLSEYAPPTVLALASRAIALQRVCNMVVTNVPGPQFPLYFRGAPMIEAFPVVPILGTVSLGIAALSYDGQVCFGLNADWYLFPDLEALGDGVRAALEELVALSGARAA